MKRKKIVCVFCGNLADIVSQDELYWVSCSRCSKETELKAYQKMIDRAVDQKRRGAYAEKVMHRAQQA